jgi:hypothetical protein
MGHGRRSEMSADDALRIAQSASPATAVAADAGEPNGVRPGQRVTVVPDDYGFDPVGGEIVASDVHEIAIRRRDEQLGDVCVHFPRLGFRVVPA